MIYSNHSDDTKKRATWSKSTLLVAARGFVTSSSHRASRALLSLNKNKTTRSLVVGIHNLCYGTEKNAVGMTFIAPYKIWVRKIKSKGRYKLLEFNNVYNLKPKPNMIMLKLEMN